MRRVALSGFARFGVDLLFEKARRSFLRDRGSSTREAAYAGYRTLAGSVISAHRQKNAVVFERALRLSERAKRLKDAGILSESACNRAARAREDALEALFELRTTFSAGVPEKARAFDEEARRIYPFLELP